MAVRSPSDYNNCWLSLSQTLITQTTALIKLNKGQIGLVCYMIITIQLLLAQTAVISRQKNMVPFGYGILLDTKSRLYYDTVQYVW